VARALFALAMRAVREPGLAERYGEAYAAYAARTGRFLPRPGQPDADPDPDPGQR
jgi:protein-S-isoprenylcysteine O-methyltransferase Ste14